MTRKTTLLLILALTLTALFGLFSVARAGVNVVSDGLVELPQVTSSTESDEPEIKDIEPDEGKPGQTLDVAITGKNTHFDASAPTEKPTEISAAAFAPSSVATGTAVSFSPPDGITVNSTTVHNATSLTVTITIAADAPVGKRDVTVTTVISDDVTEVVTKEHGFEVKEADEREEVEFEGTITSVIPGGDPITSTITVDTEDNEGEWTVHINADTRIRIGHGPDEEGTIADLAVGQQVEVEGILQDDGSVLARKIHVEQDDDDDDEVGFRGTIEAKFGVTLTVQMGPRTLTVVTNENTKIEDADDQPISFDDLEVGQQIKGEGVLQEDGSILATEIEVEEDHDDGPGHDRVRFEGVITALPSGLMGEWTVRTTTYMTVTFSVDVNTKIKPPGVEPAVGDWAKVTVVRQEGDPPLLALKVHLEKHEDRPPRPVEFRGTITDMEGDPPTKIVVDGRDVLIDDLTRIEGDLQVDAHVEVRGFPQDDGSVLARRIEVEHPDDDDEDEVEFKGRIQRIEGDMWVVGGFTVLITDTTVITGTIPPQVGFVAEVKGARVRPRTVRATEIEVEDPSDGNERVKVRGIIESLPQNTDPDDHTGTWTIATEEGGSVLIKVTSDTVIDTHHGEVKVGALVRVTALRQGDGTLVAQRIKVFESD